MGIDHEAADYPFEQLAAILRQRISDGTYPPGRKMPSNLDLVGEFGLSPMTVRRALHALEAEGLVRIVKSRGTFARRPEG